MLRLNQIFMLIIFCAIIGFSSQYEVFQKQYLISKASEKTSYWTQHFIRRLPKLGINLQEKNVDPVISTIAAGNTIGLAQDIVESSDLFQIDYINPDCFCTISVGSYAGKLSNEIRPSAPSREMAKVVFFGQHRAKKYQGHLQNNKFQFAVNFHHAKAVLNNGRNEIFIFESEQIELPQTYAAVYQILKTKDKPTLLMRTLVPLEKETHIFFVGWYSIYSALIITLLFLLYNAFKMKSQQFHPINDTFSMSPKRRTLMCSILFFLTFLLVVVGSFYSPDYQTIWDYSHDKVKHIIAYFSLTTMGLAAFHRFSWSKNLVLIIFIFGVIIELTQPLAGRSASLNDILANSIGIALGVMIASWCGFKNQITKKDAYPTGKPINQG